MTLAPHETDETHARKIELQAKKDKTLAELYELRDLCRLAIEHLLITK